MTAASWLPGAELSTTGTQVIYRGLYHQALTSMQSYLLGAVEQRMVKHTAARYDRELLQGSMLFCHALPGTWQIFEGGALSHSKPEQVFGNDTLTGSLFMGLGTGGYVGSNGLWFMTAQLERAMAARPKQGYFGQALRFGYHWSLANHTDVKLRAILQQSLSDSEAAIDWRQLLRGTVET
ncbi:MAG: hypothetical protein HY692_08090, partial [Cyanobacteria bacterium NC_groundwater_1444_Ag_S-0.65um_54_12]|nr:hypothetical protein [Cyanobacteria bacterium NC_groundwater_1444_Ag_S-0.65um_54_12]